MIKKQKSIWKFYKDQVKDSFKLTTHKISLIGIFLALTVLISLIEIPTFFINFLTIDFGTTIILLSVLIIRLPYGLLIAIVSPWLRLVIPHTVPPNVIGELSYMLSSITTIIVFFLIHGFLMIFLKVKNNWKEHLMIDIISSVLACIIISLLNTFYNWAFILDLYAMPQYKSDLWTLFLPYNLFKFFLVFLLFLILKKPMIILQKHFNL